MNLIPIIDYIADRLDERETWLSIIGLLGSAGVLISPDQASLIATIGVAVASGIIAVTKAPTNKP